MLGDKPSDDLVKIKKCREIRFWKSLQHICFSKIVDYIEPDSVRLGWLGSSLKLNLSFFHGNFKKIDCSSSIAFRSRRDSCRDGPSPSLFDFSDCDEISSMLSIFLGSSLTNLPAYFCCISKSQSMLCSFGPSPRCSSVSFGRSYSWLDDGRRVSWCNCWEIVGWFLKA